MNRRQKKKVGHRYQLLRKAERQARKRKGEKCIAYTLVEMGVNDRSCFLEDGLDKEYHYATHWLVKVLHRNQIYFDKKHAPYQTIVYPCTAHGTSDSLSIMHIIFHWKNKPEEVHPFFVRIVQDMQMDRYSEADY